MPFFTWEDDFQDELSYLRDEKTSTHASRDNGGVARKFLFYNRLVVFRVVVLLTLKIVNYLIISPLRTTQHVC